MINKNTSQKTNTTTAKTSESSIYLKRSELPKNVSSFKNDAGYISSYALDGWLKEHSYLSKSEIDNLISSANLVVIDTVNKSADADALNRLEEKINSMAGEIVAIKDRLNNVETSFIPSGKEDNFALKSDFKTLSNKITNITTTVNQIQTDSSKYASKEWVNSQGFLTEVQVLSDYAKKSDLNGYVKSNTLSDYAKKSETYSKSEINSTYLTKTEASNTYATKKDVSNTYLKKSDALKTYLKIEDYRGLKDGNVFSDKYKNNTIDEFDVLAKKDNVRDGIYVVDGDTVVVVYNQEVKGYLNSDVHIQADVNWVWEE